MNKPVAIVLGGTAPHCVLLEELKRRGYYTILIDYLKAPVAKEHADEHIMESTLDKEAVYRVAKERNASLVISAAVDQANISACYALEKLGLHTPYSYDTAVRITNKGVMKEEMIKHGIPTSRYVYFDQGQEIREIDLRYPVMVKPADSNASKGVKKANNYEEMCVYLKEAQALSRNGRAVVEEFVTGREISAYCYVKDHKARLIMTAERVCITEGEEKAIKCYATIAPARISEKAAKRAEEVTTMIADAFGINNSPLYTQAMVDGDDLFVIEFAPRVGGGTSFKTIRKNTGFDIISATLDSYLGNEVSLETLHSPENIYVINILYGKKCVFDRIEGMEALIDEGIIEEFIPYKTSGSEVDPSFASSSRLGTFIVKAANSAELNERIREAYERIEAYDTDGKPILRHDLNIVAQNA